MSALRAVCGTAIGIQGDMLMMLAAAAVEGSSGHAPLPDGAVLVSVPALMALFTRHDVGLNHYRRYCAAILRATLAAACAQRPVAGCFTAWSVPRAFAKLDESLCGVQSSPAAGPRPDRALTDAGTVWALAKKAWWR